MSNLFDALQRSKSEQDEGNSSRPAKATELLQRAEQRATSKWEVAASHVKPEATSLADNNEIVGSDTIPLVEACGCDG